MSNLVDAILTHAQVGQSAIGSIEETDTEAALAEALENFRGEIVTSKATSGTKNFRRLPFNPKRSLSSFRICSEMRSSIAAPAPHPKSRSQRSANETVGCSLSKITASG